MKRVAVFIDGGHIRACAKQAKQGYVPSLIVSIAKACLVPGEELFRIQYYDCEQFSGTIKLPISNNPKVYTGGDPFLSQLALEELVAVRCGILKFRGWERTKASLRMGKSPSTLTDSDFKAKWEQKGVDLRIGLDIVTMTESRGADLIILLTGDTDLIPAMKLARGRGLQIAGVALPNRQIIPELKPHCDFFRTIGRWP